MSTNSDFKVDGACPPDPDMKRLQVTTAQLRNTAPQERARLLSKADSLNAGELVSFHIALEEEPFDFSRFRTAEGSDREALITERKEAIAPSQDAARGAIEALGGTVESETWLVNGLVVTAKSEDVEEIATHPLVVSASVAEKATPSDNWDGEEYTVEMGTQRLFQNGYNGTYSGRDLRIAIHEVEEVLFNNMFHCDHDGWIDCSGCSSRVRRATRCTNSGCDSGSACTTQSTSTHATRVASIAAASIEQGQDPDYTGTQTLDQIRRSGHVQEALLYFYVNEAESCGDLDALQDAVANNVDVVNMSWVADDQVGSSKCNPTFDHCNMNDAFVNAVNAGTLLVAGSGNVESTSSGDCTVQWPATRSVVMSVGELNSEDPNNNQSYQDLLRDDYSFGEMSILANGGHSKDVPMVDVVAPGHIDGQLREVSEYDFTGDDGTSYAAPHVTAIAAQTREWMLDFGWPEADEPREEFANILAMGDRYWGSLSSPGSEFFYSASESTGMGRIHAHFPGSPSLGAYGGWKAFSSTISDGSTHLWEVPNNPQDPAVDGVKVSLAWFDHDYDDVGIINLELIDSCPGQGTTVLRTANSNQVMRKQVQMKGDLTQLCLWVRLTGVNIPSGGEAYYGAVYTYSHNAEEH